MNIPDRLDKHTCFGAAARTAPLVSAGTAIWFLMILNPAVLNIPDILPSELSTSLRVAASTLLGISLIMSVFTLFRGGHQVEAIEIAIDRHFAGTTWLAHSDDKLVKGLFVGVDGLELMKLSLENGAIEHVRIDHAIPVGHTLWIPGQYWRMTAADAANEARKRQRRAAQVRTALTVMSCLSAAAAIACLFVAKWGGGPLVMIAINSGFVALMASVEAKDDFVGDCAFLEDIEALRQTASEERVIEHVVADQALATEVEGRLEAKTRTILHVAVVISVFVGMSMATLLGLFPTLRALENHPDAAPDLLGMGWAAAGLLLSFGAIFASTWYDRMMLLPKSYFSGHGWIAPGGAVGQLEDSIRGGSVLKLRFPDGRVEEHAIEHLRRGNALPA